MVRRSVGRWLQDVLVGGGSPKHRRPRVSIVITAVAIVLAVGHLLYPTIAIDGITIALFVISIAPWLGLVFKGFQFAGLGVEYHELERAEEAVAAAGLVAAPTPTQKDEVPPSVRDDPLLALAALRIELERRLRQIAESHGVSLAGRPGSVRMIADELQSNGVITSQQASAIADMAGTLNRAVHAEEVDPRAAEWALKVGPSILASLDAKVSTVAATRSKR
jgi:hypothetical protein